MTGMPATPAPVIELSQVTKTYGEGEGQVRAVRGVDPYASWVRAVPASRRA